jgi:hypothetical protein
MKERRFIRFVSEKFKSNHVFVKDEIGFPLKAAIIYPIKMDCIGMRNELEK